MTSDANNENNAVNQPPPPENAEDTEAIARRSKQAIATALADPEFQAQIRESLAAKEAGIPGVPWRQVRDEARARDREAGV